MTAHKATHKALVCWSGGCDSTLVLHEMARVYGTPSYPVRAVAITSDQVTARSGEKRARKRLLKTFHKQGLHIDFLEIHIESVTGDGMKHHGLPQAVLWLNASQMLRKTEHLVLGYIKGDCWIEYRAEFNTIFTNLQTISDRTGSLWTPLRYIQKPAVLADLKKRDLLDLTWWCESPKGRGGSKTCGDCASCQRHETALWRLAKHGAGYSTWSME